MLNWEELMDISILYKEGHSIKQIVRMTGYSRNTVRKALRKE
jgi:transposase